MKTAGQKNDGAWFRANKFIKELGGDGQSALSAQLSEDNDVIAMYAAAVAIANIAGYPELPGPLSSVSAWTTQMTTTGIPRQVWTGTLTWDTYTASADVPPKYTPDHLTDWRRGASAIRRIVMRFRLARRQLLDFANEVSAVAGNPGGIADADITT